MMDFYEYKDGCRIQQGKIGVQIVDGHLRFVTCDGKNRQFYESSRCALSLSGGTASFVPRETFIAKGELWKKAEVS